MHTRSNSILPQKLDKNLTSFFQEKNQITPKKQNLLVKVQQLDIQPTLQKKIIFDSVKQVHETIQKDKRRAKRPWTRQEDHLLIELVENKGAKQWACISSYFIQRCGKQCRERWHNHLRNGIKKGEWSYYQEWILFLGVHSYGKRWSTISKLLEGRTQNTLKNHWNCKMKPKMQGFQKKLDTLRRNILIKGIYLSNLEIRLLNEIKSKPQPFDENSSINQKEQTKLKTICFQEALKNFYQMKKLIYNRFEMETTGDQFSNQSYKLDWKMVQTFGKDKQSDERSIVNKIKTEDIEYDQVNPESFEMCQNFQIESNSEKLKIHGSVKSASNMQEIFDVNENNHFKHDNIHFEHGYSHFDCTPSKQQESHYKSMIECKSVSGGFCSPIRQNIFEGIDLGESNKKKQLFN